MFVYDNECNYVYDNISLHMIMKICVWDNGRRQKHFFCGKFLRSPCKNVTKYFCIFFRLRKFCIFFSFSQKNTYFGCVQGVCHPPPSFTDWSVTYRFFYAFPNRMFLFIMQLLLVFQPLMLITRSTVRKKYKAFFWLVRVTVQDS